MAGVHDEGLPPTVVLAHVQALIDAKVLYLQNSEQGGEPGEHSQEFCSSWYQAQIGINLHD